MRAPKQKTETQMPHEPSVSAIEAGIPSEARIASDAVFMLARLKPYLHSAAPSERLAGWRRSQRCRHVCNGCRIGRGRRYCGRDGQRTGTRRALPLPLRRSAAGGGNGPQTVVSTSSTMYPSGILRLCGSTRCGDEGPIMSLGWLPGAVAYQGRAESPLDNHNLRVGLIIVPLLTQQAATGGRCPR